MTEAPIEWHPDADFFRVVCRLGAILPDGSAADTKPDLTTKAGTVTISSTAPGRILVMTEADGHDRIMGYSGETYTVDAATGELIAADGTVGLQLLSPTSDRVKPQGYPYTATIKIGLGGPSVTVTFDATPTHPDGTVDLARLVVEPVMDGMTPTTVAQQLAAMQVEFAEQIDTATTKAAEAAQSAADAATAKAGAETAQGAAAGSASTASTAATNAQAARTGAETARTGAETAASNAAATLAGAVRHDIAQSLAAPAQAQARANIGAVSAARFLEGTGMPNGVVAAPPGAYYTDTSGTNGAWVWLKTSGTGTTGWVKSVYGPVTTYAWAGSAGASESVESADGVEVRRNLVQNPAGTSLGSLSGWALAPGSPGGTGYAQTYAVGTSAPVVLSGVRVPTLRSQTWTTVGAGAANDLGYKLVTGTRPSVTPGTAVGCEWWWRPSWTSGGGTSRLEVRWYDAAGTQVGAPVTVDQPAAAAGVWQRIRHVTTVPAGVASVSVGHSLGEPAGTIQVGDQIAATAAIAVTAATEAAALAMLDAGWFSGASDGFI